MFGALQLKKVGKLNQASEKFKALAKGEAVRRGRQRGWLWKGQVWGEGAKLDWFYHPADCSGSSQASSVGLLASLLILPKPGGGEEAD